MVWGDKKRSKKEKRIVFMIGKSETIAIESNLLTFQRACHSFILKLKQIIIECVCIKFLG